MFSPHQPKEGLAGTQHNARRGFAKLNLQRTGKKSENLTRGNVAMKALRKHKSKTRGSAIRSWYLAYEHH